MSKHNDIDKINNLTVNLACFGLGIVLTTATFTGYDLVNTNIDTKDITFESIEAEEVDASTASVTIPTHFDEVITNIEDLDEYKVEENQEYSGMNVSHSFEDYIKELCEKYASKYDLDYDTLYETVMVIGDQESDGKWNNNGVISPTEDYGEFQINITNHQRIEEKFGYTTDDLLNDKYKNAAAAVWIVSNIMTTDYCETAEDAYGMYNGWINWKEKEDCVKYVDGCLARADEYFGEIKYLAKR